MDAIFLVVYVLCVMIGAVFVTEMLKLAIEKQRKKKTEERKFVFTKNSGEKLEKIVRYFADGKEYKKLKGLYQASAFLMAFGGISCLLIFVSGSGFNIYNVDGGIDLLALFKTLGVAMLLAGTEAKLFEIYESAGARGLFRWLVKKCKHYSDTKALARNTSEELAEEIDKKEKNVVELLAEAGQDILEIISEKKPKNGKVKKEKKVNLNKKKVVKYLAQELGQEFEYVETMIRLNKADKKPQ